MGIEFEFQYQLGSNDPQHNGNPSSWSYQCLDSRILVGKVEHHQVSQFLAVGCSSQLGLELDQLSLLDNSSLVDKSNIDLGQSYQSCIHQKYQLGMANLERQHLMDSSKPAHMWQQL